MRSRDDSAHRSAAANDRESGCMKPLGFGVGAFKAALVFGLFVGAIGSVVALSACGSETRGDAVAVVAGESITKATLEHWIPIEAVISRESFPEHPVPPGEIPDPPGFAACIGYSKASREREGGVDPGRSLTPKAECKRRYESIRAHILQILITYRWLIAEAASQGIRVSDAEVHQSFRRYKRLQFGTEAKYQRFLKYTGQTTADQLLIIKVDELSTKLQQKLLTENGTQGAASFYRRFARKWAAKTSCRPEYVIPECKEYKGSQPPEASI